MIEERVTAQRPRDVGVAQPPASERAAHRRPWFAWLIGTVAVIGVALLFVLVTGMRPAYDAYGWLVWGRQALHLNLGTNSAPSWKPLTFLFTLPYAIAGRGALYMWMVTAVAGAVAGAVFGARIAFRLTADSTRRFVPYVAATCAGLGVLGINGYGHMILIAYADPLIVALCLGAIDCQLSGRPRLAWLLLVLAACGRPEAWLVVGAYAVWSWRAQPAMRGLTVIGVGAIGALWFVIPALTSPSALISGDIAQTSGRPVTGDKVGSVFDRYFSLYEFPMQLAALVAVLVAVIERRTRWLVLAAAAVAWVGVEMAFAFHGWPASPRYMFEPAALMAVLAGAGIGRLLDVAPRTAVVRWAGAAVAIGLLVAIVPQARIRGRLLHNGIVLGHSWARQIHRLQGVIAREGGQKRILACGRVVTEIPFQSILAWEIGENVEAVGWNPPAATHQPRPTILFEPTGAGWVISVYHIADRDRGRCDSLPTHTSLT
ncbi:MAG: hypothetical protein M3016_07415 [Actinomycetota bacterium]|nr:hypothetical protein [Actinomycetota bacterium]